MSPRVFTLWEILQALTVDAIRRLWDDGQHVNNKWLRAIHANWFNVWVDWKTDLTMRDVDRQAAEIVDMWEANEDPAVDAYAFSETQEGETPLGGEMRLTARWEQDDTP